jgi:hypothetical protein
MDESTRISSARYEHFFRGSDSPLHTIISPIMAMFVAWIIRFQTLPSRRV